MASWFKSRLSSPRTPRPSPEELFQLARRYLMQQTLGPLREMVRGLGLGLAGAIVVSAGAAIALLGVLRLLQGETGSTFAGNWSFAPYLISAAAGVIFIVGAVGVGLRSHRAERRNH